MKILLSNDFSDILMKQEKALVSKLLTSIEKIRNFTKSQMLALDTVVDLSSPKDKTKLYAYNIDEKYYIVFSFTNKNEMILFDYVQLRNGSVISLTYPDTSTTED